MQGGFRDDCISLGRATRRIVPQQATGKAKASESSLKPLYTGDEDMSENQSQDDSNAVAAYEEMRAELQRENPKLFEQLNKDHSELIGKVKLAVGNKETASLWLIYLSLRIAAMAESGEL